MTIFIGLPSIMTETDFSLPTLLLLAALGIFQAGAGYSLLTAGLKLCEPLAGSLVASIEPVLNPILVAVFYLGGELADAVTAADNVSQLSHIIGGVCGAVLGFALQKR